MRLPKISPYHISLILYASGSLLLTVMAFRSIICSQRDGVQITLWLLGAMEMLVGAAISLLDVYYKKRGARFRSNATTAKHKVLTTDVGGRTMVEGFKMGASVRSKNSDAIGNLVEGPDKKYGDNFPHYAREGFYYVKFVGIKQVRVMHEDDLVLLTPTKKKECCGDCGK